MQWACILIVTTTDDRRLNFLHETIFADLSFFADRIDSAASALTPDVLKRHSILAGGKGNDIDKIFQYRVFSRSADYHGSGKKRNNTVDIIYFVELLQKEKLVQPMGCRNFSSHPELIHQINIKSPSVLVKNSLTLYQTWQKKKSCCQWLNHVWMLNYVGMKLNGIFNGSFWYNKSNLS